MIVKGIQIQNVYYMLAYVYRVLREGCYTKVAGEEFEHAEDLFGQILALGMAHLVKQGLFRTYEEVLDELSGSRGRIDLSGTLRLKAARRQHLSCVYDEFTVDNQFNRIIKSTALALMRTGKLQNSGEALKRVLVFFGEVGVVELHHIHWTGLQYARNNQHYVMLINVCRFVVEGMLMGEANSGNRQMQTFEPDEKSMHALYEAFLREYFAYHYGQKLESKRRNVPWDISDNSRDASLLPTMQTDVSLSNGEKTLIIDAKFYKETLQNHYGNMSVHSANLYQLYSYVQNERAHLLKKNNCVSPLVSGMLLYAKTCADVQPESKWTIGGCEMEVGTLDLGQDFGGIAKRLDSIVEYHFGMIEKVHDF